MMDQIFNSIRDKVKPAWKIAFFSAFTAGLLTHMYVMSNNFLTADSMWNMISRQDMIASGRQFLTYACRISSDYSLPWLNGILAILYLSLAAVFFTEIFQIKSRLLIILTGAMTVTFPVVAATFAYSFTIDGYALAIFLSAASFLLCDRIKYGFLPASVLLCLTIGMYQSYFSVTILLCIFSLVLMLLRGIRTKEFFRKAACYIFMGAAGYALYVISLKIMVSLKGAYMTGYQGTDKVTSFRDFDLITGVFTAIKTFFRYFKPQGYYFRFGFMVFFFVLFLLCAAIGYVVLFFKLPRSGMLFPMVCSLFLFLCVPVAACLPCVISPDVYFHTIMRYPMLIVLLFCIAVLSDWEQVCMDALKETGALGFKKKLERAAVICGAFAAMILSLEYAVIDNIMYFNLNERYEKSYAMCIELVKRIHETEGYSPYMPVAILGGAPNRNYYPWIDDTQDMLGNVQGVSGDYIFTKTEDYAVFCRHYLGIALVTLDMSSEYALIETPEFTEMGCFPEKDGIRIINGVLVIKMGG